MNCTCGHADDEHGTKNKKKHPNSKQCLVKGCPCLMYEADENAEDEDDS